MENRCVCCGAIIPEGRMVCPICEIDADEVPFVGIAGRRKKMKTGTGLAEYAIAQLGKPYWWGTFGQVADGALYAKKKKQYPGKYIEADYPKQYGQRVHDCVGLIKGYRWSDNPDSEPRYAEAQDVAVEGLYAQCTQRGAITSLPEKPGVCVFMAGLGHVGVYIGGGEVVEAMGHAYGVVKTKLAGRGWAYWGMPDWISYEGSGAVVPPSVGSADSFPKGGAFSLSFRILREGCVGEDVKALQMMLKARGYQCGYYGANGDGADGEFGAATKKQLISYQRVNGLEPDGEAGPDTMSALLGIN